MKKLFFLALSALIVLGVTACKNIPNARRTIVSGIQILIPEPIHLNDTVTANTDAIHGESAINYQWQTGVSADGPFTDIEGAVEKSFTVTENAGVTAGCFLRLTVVREDSIKPISSKAVLIGSERIHTFIDFSAITMPGTLGGNQPPEEQQGLFTLDNGITGNGLRISGSGENNPVQVVYNSGKTAIQVQGLNEYLYFFVDNNELKTAGLTNMVITFFDSFAGNFDLHYINTERTVVQLTIPTAGTKNYVTAKFELDGCNFSARLSQGAQFRITNNIIIQRLELITGALASPLSASVPDYAPDTSLNNLSGKLVTGYQLWFRAGNSWGHWSKNSRMPGPGDGNVAIELWPAGFDDYRANGANLYDTDYVNPDGKPALLFNAMEKEIIRTQMKWMQDSGIHCAAVQRFFGVTAPVDTGNSETHLTRVMEAAEEFGRIFYINYDFAGAGPRFHPDVEYNVRRMKLDWIYNVERKGLLESPNYAKAEGKPIVHFWCGFADESKDNYRYLGIDATIELIEWFRSRGCYVIGGLNDNTWWVEHPIKHPRGIYMHTLFDMIIPWYIGRDIYGNILSGNNLHEKGLQFCRENRRKWAGNKPIAFMPTIWPGFAWSNMGYPNPPNSIPRNAGQWAWGHLQQYLNRDSKNEIQNLFISMFDEYDEGTNWIKAAADSFDLPKDQYFLTYAADGIWLSHDYYLRLANAIAGALEKKLAAGGGSTTAGTPGFTPPLNDYSNPNSVIVEHSLGPVFWRNGFERRKGRSIRQNGTAVPVGHLPLDVGVPNGGVIGSPQNVNITGKFTINRYPAARDTATDRYTLPSEDLGMVYVKNAKSGDSAFRLAGERTAGNTASYLYKIADVRIKVEPGMMLSFWQRTENSLGSNVIVDLQFENGTFLSDSVNAQNTGFVINGWQQKIVAIPASINGHYITSVIVAYRDSGTTTGNFAAFIDDIFIQK